MIESSCTFCRIGVKGLAELIPSKENGGVQISCRRKIYEDSLCLAILAPEQYSKGHTLVVLKAHREDIADPNLSEEELAGFVSVIHAVAINIKKVLHPERIYSSVLCDGVKHLHAHLIPRYLCDQTGFGFIGKRESEYNLGTSDFWKKSDAERVGCLEKLASELRFTL